MRRVHANDDTGMWDVCEDEAGDAPIASFESESMATEFAAVPELLAACEAFVEARRKWRSDKENETIDSITYLDMLDAIDFDAAVAKARNP